ncbi:MAG: transcriptional repressor [Acidobacteria bacterium]|nr:MAG: transcriptional repressor [Acidobacteriota bacterium]
MRTAAEMTELYRQKGLKITPQRQCIFGILEANTTHPTADAIYESALETMPSISRKTVYTVLHELNELGELLTLDVGTGSLRFDPNVERHHHTVCRKCGSVGDVRGIDTARVRMPASEQVGFEVEETEVIFRGICKLCRPKGRKS